MDMDDLPMLIAPFVTLACVIVAAWYFGKRNSQHRERTNDLRETHKAMIAHFNAMDKVVADEAVPATIKRSLMQVSSALADRKIAELICREIIESKGRRGDTKSVFQAAVENLKADNPGSFAEVETAMASALFVLMLRWPETSRNFKQFVISAMIDEKREVAIFDRASEIAKRVRNAALQQNAPYDLDAAVA